MNQYARKIKKFEDVVVEYNDCKRFGEDPMPNDSPYVVVPSEYPYPGQKKTPSDPDPRIFSVWRNVSGGVLPSTDRNVVIPEIYMAWYANMVRFPRDRIMSVLIGEIAFFGGMLEDGRVIYDAEREILPESDNASDLSIASMVIQTIRFNLR